MAIPTEKNRGIDRLIQAINPEHRDRRSSIEQDICVWCGNSAVEFTDELSRKEYSISGLCQKCQDKMFNTGESND